MANEIENTLHLLCSTSRIERERGSSALEVLLAIPKNENGFKHFLENDLLASLEKCCSWEMKYGYLMFIKGVISSRGFVHSIDVSVVNAVAFLCLECLKDEEARVRLAGGEVLGAICKINTLQAFKEFIPPLLSLTKGYLKDNEEDHVENINFQVK